MTENEKNDVVDRIAHIIHVLRSMGPPPPWYRMIESRRWKRNYDKIMEYSHD